MPTIDLAPLDLRAALSSVNDERRTADLVFSTGAPVARVDPSGRRFLEVLSLDPAHVRLDRMNAGAPLLDTHSAESLTDQIGVVVEGSAYIVDGREARCTVRFSRRPAVDPIWQDVRDGIVRNVSVGYRVHKFEEPANPGRALPTWRAVDWEPFEVSLVPMGADPRARVRGRRLAEALHPCVIARAGLSIADADRNRRLRLAQARVRALTAEW